MIHSARYFQAATIEQPWLSVVLPTYNGEEWVHDALASVATDPDPGIEIVVIDTSTSPDTLAIVDSFADRLRLSIYRPDDIDGCTLKTNFGVEMARAPHVTWLCQDDIWLPGRANAIRRWIAAAPTAALHLAPSAIVDRDGRQLGVWRCPLPDMGRPLDPELLCERLLVQNFVGVVSPVISRAAWLACGGIDRELWYTGDWDLWLKLARHGDVHYRDLVTAAFRIHGNSATSTRSRNIEDFIAQHRQVVERHLVHVSPERQSRVRRLADGSICVNAGLAMAAHGMPGGIARAIWTLFRLGPVGAWQYLHFSRLIERVMPRVRAKFAKAF